MTTKDELRLIEPEYNGATTFRGFRAGCTLNLLLWGFVLVLGVGVARAAGSTCGDIPMPPPRYDHVPNIPFSVRSVDFGATNRVCAVNGVGVLAPLAGGDNYRVRACSFRGAVAGTVILPIGGGWTDQQRACALRHELAHLNGWPASHPDARFE